MRPPGPKISSICSDAWPPLARGPDFERVEEGEPVAGEVLARLQHDDEERAAARGDGARAPLKRPERKVLLARVERADLSRPRPADLQLEPHAVLLHLLFDAVGQP